MADSTDNSSSEGGLKGLSLQKLEELVHDVEAAFETRDDVWTNRRKVRFRKMDAELKALPLSNRAGSNQALMVFQTEEPNQEIHRRVKRLVANKPRIEAIIYEDNPEQKTLAQNTKDALAALYKWMNRGKTPPERLVVAHQQGDGLGIFKLDFFTDYAEDTLMYYDPESLEAEVDDPSKLAPEQIKARQVYSRFKTELAGSGEFMAGVDLEATAYKKSTDYAKRTCDPPFRLSSVDPLTVKYRKDGDAVTIVVEKGKRPVAALLQAYKGKNLRLSGNRFVAWPDNQDALEGDTIPDNGELEANYDNLVDYVEIRSRHDIVIIIDHPEFKDKSKRRSSSRVKVEGSDGKVVLRFDNPFGPYSTGYVLVPGDITGSFDPADEFQPPVLGTLNVAQAMNVLRTIRMSAAIDAALKSKYVKVADAQPPPQLDQSKTDKTPTVKDGREIPQIPGEVKREESPTVDLDKAENAFTVIEAEHRFNEVLSGDAQSSDSGHKLAIQVSQADTQLVPYQTTRAEATAELLMCCLYAAKKLGQTIYVRELPDSSTIGSPSFSSVQAMRAITPEMFDLDFELIVSIGSETPVTKFAKWAALDQRFKGGTLSLETLMEESDVENVDDELARIFEGNTLVASMQQIIPIMTGLVMQRAMQKIAPPGAPAPMAGDSSGAPMEGGNENGGGMSGAQASTPVAQIGRLPGVGLSPGGPTTGEDGMRVQEGAGDMGGP